jgi:hypothetical protein
MSVFLSEGREACQGKGSENSELRPPTTWVLKKSHGSKDPQKRFQELINLWGEKGSDLLSDPPKINSAAKVPTAELVVTP